MGKDTLSAFLESYGSITIPDSLYGGELNFMTPSANLQHCPSVGVAGTRPLMRNYLRLLLFCPKFYGWYRLSPACSFRSSNRAVETCRPLIIIVASFAPDSSRNIPLGLTVSDHIALVVGSPSFCEA